MGSGVVLEKYRDGVFTFQKLKIYNRNEPKDIFPC